MMSFQGKARSSPAPAAVGGSAGRSRSAWTREGRRGGHAGMAWRGVADEIRRSAAARWPPPSTSPTPRPFASSSRRSSGVRSHRYPGQQRRVLRVRPVLDLTEELWDRTQAVNLKGYFLFGQCVARQMVHHQEGGGKILNISSRAAERPVRRRSTIASPRPGSAWHTPGMALELARHQIQVNAIAPGTIDTEIVRQPNIQALVERERQRSSIPLGRMGTAADVVGAALFLCSPAADYVTGATLLVDGGILSGSLLPEGIPLREFPQRAALPNTKNQRIHSGAVSIAWLSPGFCYGPMQASTNNPGE